MAHSEVVIAIETHVRSVFPHCPIYAEDEETETPTDAGPFLVVSFPYARSEQDTVGEIDDATFEEEGAFNLTLALPRGAGVREGRLWLEQAADTMRARHIGSVWCGSPQSAVLDDDRDDTAHVRLMMSVPYRYWVAG